MRKSGERIKFFCVCSINHLEAQAWVRSGEQCAQRYFTKSKQRTEMKLYNSEVPCQLPADLPSAVELEQLPDGAVRFAAIKRCLSRGLVGTQPSAHFSLDLNTPTAGGGSITSSAPV